MAFILQPVSQALTQEQPKTNLWSVATQSTLLREATASLADLAVSNAKPVIAPTLISPSTIELRHLPLDFSVSRLLSPGADASHSVIVKDGRTLDAVSLICLALNEQGRMFMRGCLYPLPSRADESQGHPCDAVFVDELWEDSKQTIWDRSNWVERLEMVDAITKLTPGQRLIPLCLRILRYDSPVLSMVDSDLPTWSSILTPDCNGSEGGFFDGLSNGHVYYSRSDPVVKPGIYQYSRPVEDVSTYLVTYNSHRSTPFVCMTAAAEHTSLCRRTPTPNDLSETFVRLVETTEELKRRRSQRTASRTAERAAELVLQGGVGAHVGVITALIRAWSQEVNKNVVDLDQTLFGRVTYLWQELKNRMDENDAYRTAEILSLWNEGLDSAK